MNTKPEPSFTENHPNMFGGIIKRAGTVVIFLVLIAVILFLAAGRLNWIWAWIYLGISLLSLILNGMIMLRTSPETIAERSRPEETKDWDKIVGGLWGVAIYFVLPLVAGLDVRFGWARDLNLAWHVAGALAYAIGLGLTAWAMVANAYFSTAVRIQSERGHTVCSSGPYRFVRHPGYAGFILQSIAIPFLLGSLWSLIPGITATVLMIVRTSLEDGMLQAELPGYQDYAQKVSYRLLPGIW